MDKNAEPEGFAAIIDDEQKQQRFLSKPLQRLGFGNRVECHVSPKDLPKHDYVLFLVDMFWDQELMGPGYCLQLKRDYPKAMILGVTNDPKSEVEKAAKDSGVFKLLDKSKVTTKTLRDLYREFQEESR